MVGCLDEPDRIASLRQVDADTGLLYSSLYSATYFIIKNCACYQKKNSLNTQFTRKYKFYCFLIKIGDKPVLFVLRRSKCKISELSRKRILEVFKGLAKSGYRMLTST